MSRRRDWSKFGSGSVSNEEYQNFKKRVENNSIVRRVIPMSDLEIISDKLVGYAGVEFEITENAFKNLVKILGLSNGVMKTVTDKLGENVTSRLVSMMKTAIMAEKNSICLLVNKSNAKIVGFTNSAESILSNNAYFSLLEQTMNNHKGMEIKNMSITDAGNIEISVLNNNWEFNVGGLNDEFFKSGLVFINTPDKTIINPFNERLVCTNGLEVSSAKGMSLILSKNDSGSVSGFFDKVTNLKGINNFEQEFKARIVRMMDTQASYDEMLTVHKAVTFHVMNTQEEMTRANIESFIPLSEVKQAYLQHNIDLNLLDSKKYKKIRTMLSVWDLVNKLTDLSSHPRKYGFDLVNGSSSIFELQRLAGDITFKSEYDLEEPFKQLF